MVFSTQSNPGQPSCYRSAHKSQFTNWSSKGPVMQGLVCELHEVSWLEEYFTCKQRSLTCSQHCFISFFRFHTNMKQSFSNINVLKMFIEDPLLFFLSECLLIYCFFHNVSTQKMVYSTLITIVNLKAFLSIYLTKWIQWDGFMDCLTMVLWSMLSCLTQQPIKNNANLLHFTIVKSNHF